MNNLNQLSNATRSGTLTVAGATTIAASSVTVNNLTADRYADNTFSRTNLSLSDGNNTFTAVATDSLSRGDTNALTVNLPATLTFLYDQNGNLRTNGSVVMAYDEENQLIAMTNAGAWASTFTYDGKMRLRISRDYEWRNGAWVQTNEIRRVYDGMLVLQERDSFNVPKLTYTRGSDLSGSLEGAGGIGGLLALSDHSTLNSGSLSTFFFHSDGNGNVTCLVGTNQIVVARYLYDPFGNTLSATGPKAGFNRYRFSSKEWHAPSGMVYYGYRWYVPELQRWLNRDPLERAETADGVNLYEFVGNHPTISVDPDGRHVIVIGGGGVVFGGVVITVGACYAIPACRKALEEAGKAALEGLGELLRRLCRPRPRPPENCPKTGEMDQPAIGKPGDTGYVPAMKICIYTCPKQGVVRRYFPEGTSCDGSITQPWP